MSDQMSENSRKTVSPDGFAYRPKVIDPQPRETMTQDNTELRRSMADEKICAPMGKQITGVRGK